MPGLKSFDFFTPGILLFFRFTAFKSANDHRILLHINVMRQLFRVRAADSKCNFEAIAFRYLKFLIQAGTLLPVHHIVDTADNDTAKTHGFRREVHVFNRNTSVTAAPFKLIFSV